MVNFDPILEEYPDQKLFRFQHNKVHLTYSGELSHHDLISFIEEEFPTKSLKFHSIVNETSDDGYVHTHAFFQWLERHDFTNPRRFDYNKIHPHIRLVKSKVHVDNILEYHQKTGNHVTENIKASPLIRRKKVTKLTESELKSRLADHGGDFHSMMDAENVTIRDAASVTSDYYTQMPIRIKEDEPPFETPDPILQQVFSKATETPDPINVFWYLSKDVFNNRQLIKHFTYYKWGTFVPEVASYYRMATAAENHILRRGVIKTILIDAFDEKLPDDFIKTIFLFKTGRIQGGKRMMSLDFPTPQIIILSPFLPPVDFILRPDGNLRIIYSKYLTIIRSDIKDYVVYRDKENQFDLDKIEEVNNQVQRPNRQSLRHVRKTTPQIQTITD